MAVCEICGENALELKACRQCGVHFCDHDGYFEKHLCLDCGGEEEESQEDQTEDTLEEKTEIEGEETVGEEPEQDEEVKDAKE